MSFIGPVLPPHLKHLMSNTEEEADDDDNADKKDETKEETEKEKEDLYGPILPPGFQKEDDDDEEEEKPSVIGPVLPPGVKLGNTEEADDSEEDDVVVGPLPAPVGMDPSDYIKYQFDSRAERMKEKIEGKNKPTEPEREEWMLELPKDRSGLLGLGPRSFRKNAAPDNKDTSSWTDTPSDKLKKSQGKASSSMSSAEQLEARAMKRRDEEMAERAAKHANKRSSESLLDSHQKKIEKKKKEEPKEREMFDREKDLQVNRFDEAQKKAVVNKAKFLNDRFSSGAQKFL